MKIKIKIIHFDLHNQYSQLFGYSPMRVQNVFKCVRVLVVIYSIHTPHSHIKSNAFNPKLVTTIVGIRIIIQPWLGWPVELVVRNQSISSIIYKNKSQNFCDIAAVLSVCLFVIGKCTNANWFECEYMHIHASATIYLLFAIILSTTEI